MIYVWVSDFLLQELYFEGIAVDWLLYNMGMGFKIIHHYMYEGAGSVLPDQWNLLCNGIHVA